MTFQLAACAEMLWRDRPIDWRASRLKEMGFGVGLWNWPDLGSGRAGKDRRDLHHHERLSAGPPDRRRGLRDAAGLGTRNRRRSASGLASHRLNLHGTGLGDMGMPDPADRRLRPRHGAARPRHAAPHLRSGRGRGRRSSRWKTSTPSTIPAAPSARPRPCWRWSRAVNRPQLRINLDLYHTQIGEGDLIRWCQACLPWIGEVQVADNPGRCEPGTGEINYRRRRQGSERHGLLRPGRHGGLRQGR